MSALQSPVFTPPMNKIGPFLLIGEINYSKIRVEKIVFPYFGQ